MEYEIIINNINNDNWEALDINDTNTENIIYKLEQKKWIKKVNNHYQKIRKQKLVVGSLDVKPKFGFLLGAEDYYIHKVHHYFTNDIILGYVKKGPAGKDEAVIMNLLQRPEDVYLILKVSDNGLIAINKEYQNYHFLLREKIHLLTNYFIKVKVLKSTKDHVLVSFIEKIIFNDQYDQSINLILAQNNITTQFDNDVLLAANKMENIDYDHLQRVDLCDKAFITIDGASSKDLDDAVYLEKENEMYHLYVSIADVSNFVKPQSVLDQEAYQRGNSVYFLDCVIPMLPFKLSNDLCSLNEGVKRFSMTCEMLIDPFGNVVKQQVYPSIIKSQGRLTYSEVNDLLVRNIITPHLEKHQNMLYIMDELREILFNKRKINGAFDFEETEVKFLLNDKQEIVDIIPIIRENGEKLIEEFMILANHCVAYIINKMEQTFLYRIHQKPASDELLALKQQLIDMGFNTNTNVLANNFYYDLKNSLVGDCHSIIDKLVIKLMPKAEYSTKNIGHFGLALEDYTHFTSPIRRYSDLIVHRLLKLYLIDHQKLDHKAIDSLNQAAKHITLKEIDAMNAERSIIDLKKTEYFKKFENQQFVGRISNIYENKIIIELANTIRGSVFLDDYIEFERVEHYCVYFKNCQLHLLDEVQVKVKEVNLEKNKIVFSLLDFTQKKLPPKNKKPRNKYKTFR